MRLFVALVLPDPAADHLDAALASHRDRYQQLRWVTRERWHLTLVFLGEVPETTLPELGKRLARAAGRHPPLSLRFERAGRFGDRVLWTAVGGDVEALRRLADSASAAVRRSGVSIEERRYRPHLTLARGRGRTDLKPLVAALASYSGPEWTASSLHLVRSTLGPHPRYDDVECWPLTGSADAARR